MSGNFIYVHHVESRDTLYVPRAESFPILKYIEVARTTNTSLDVMLERDFDDNRNVDGDRDTRFTVLNEKPPDGRTWSGWRPT